MIRQTFIICSFLMLVSSFTKASERPELLNSAVEANSATEWICISLNVPALPNAYRVHDRVISGGQPDGDTGFAALKKLGVKTVISVDGIRPDIETARRFGLRYVHLPHGYDGVPSERGYELAKAVLSLPGPTYVHCHHGKHRSPAAAAVACIVAGLIPRNAGEQILRAAGTSPDYRGLYASVSNAIPLDRDVLESLNVSFHETVDLPPVVKVMTQIGQTFDNIYRIADNDWKTPAEHPDVSAAHEILLLKEYFAEFERDPSLDNRSPQFRVLIEESKQQATLIESLLKTDLVSRGDKQIATDALIAMKTRCTSCHRRFRD